MGRWRCRTWLLALPALLAAACEARLPEAPAGRAIRGLISYGGTAHQGYRRPALQILALAEPPRLDMIKRPHALTILEPERYDAPVPYELGPLPPFRYRVVARLIDLDNLKIPDTELATGSHPNICAFLGGPPEGNVAVTDDAITEGIDITLYDRAGAGDPCHTAPPPVSMPELCPQAGAGTLQVRLQFKRPPGQLMNPDQLNFAVLTALTDYPTRLRLIAANTLAQAGFPYTIVFTDVPPNSYLVVACYDVGGDDLTTCGMEDFSASYMNQGKLAVAAGKVTRVELDLDTGMGVLLGVDEPSAYGCR